RLHVRDAEDVVRVGHGLVREKVGAAVDEDREAPELLGDGTERRGVAARGYSTEEVDLLRQLQPAKLLDVGVGSRGLVSLEDLDLPLAEEAAGGVDLLCRQQLTLVHGLAEQRRRPREERLVAALVRSIRNISLVLLLCVHAPAV